MTVRPQQAGALMAIGLVICVLVLVCLSALLWRADGTGGGGDEEPGLTGGEEPVLPGSSEGDGSLVTSYATDRSLEEEAGRILGSYEEQGSCVLREAGFLDLFGNAWTCTVQGPSWVDVCLVSGGDGSAGDAGSSVRVIRMDLGEWGRAYGQAME